MPDAMGPGIPVIENKEYNTGESKDRSCQVTDTIKAFPTIHGFNKQLLLKEKV
jgi:hypothetical protein